MTKTVTGSKGKTDHQRLWYVLSDLFTQVFEKAPDVDNPIRIAAWYLSHSHFDHYDNFYQFCYVFGSNVIVESLIANFASDAETYNCYDPNPHVRDTVDTLDNFLQQPITYYKMHSGLEFYIRNVKLEILYTHEDVYPQVINLFNDTSTVIRMTIYHTDGSGIPKDAEGTTAMWTGDLYDRGSKNLRAMYGEYLQSDMLQISHHGYIGCEFELYALVAPTCVWWPTDRNTFARQVSGQFSSGPNVVNYRVYTEIESIKYIILGDGFNTTMTFTADGPVYDIGGKYGLYNADDSALESMLKIAYGTYIIKK